MKFNDFGQRGLTPISKEGSGPLRFTDPPSRVYTRTDANAGVRRDDERRAASGAAAEHRGAQRRIATAGARNERELQNERVLERDPEECC